MTTELKIEYRIVPVTRYIVTRWYSETDAETDSHAGGSEQRGEFDHEDTAYDVAYALAKAEHEAHGWPIDDERIRYPERVEDSSPA